MVNYALAYRCNFKFEESKFYRFGLLQESIDTGKSAFVKSMIYRVFTHLFLNRFLDYAKQH